MSQTLWGLRVTLRGHPSLCSEASGSRNQPLLVLQPSALPHCLLITSLLLLVTLMRNRIYTKKIICSTFELHPNPHVSSSTSFISRPPKRCLGDLGTTRSNPWSMGDVFQFFSLFSSHLPGQYLVVLSYL